ncbi:MAG TPA: alkaline phosphatase family protein [Anaerolineaceae bacterium]|nr:alkaline phosphatase family protein [Anaerolineaceae bacterium]
MPDLSAQFLPRLTAPRFPELSLADEFVYPDYAGYSLLNLPETICAWLGVHGLGGTPLAGEILEPLGTGIRRVILFLLDGLGFDLFCRCLDDDSGLIWNRLLPDAIFSPLTSVVPSTTASALTTLWTGKAPGAHGIVGYELWLKEFGVVANMIQQGVMAYGADPDGLKRAGFRPEAFLGLPTLGAHLQQAGVRSKAYISHSLARSGLSAMHFPGVEVFGYRGTADLILSLAQHLEAGGAEPELDYVYWETLDTLSHLYGPWDPRVRVELEVFSGVFANELLPKLQRRGSGGTLVLVTADHGLIHTPRNTDLELRNHPDLARMLHLLPSGEHRFAYLFIRPGREAEVANLVERKWPGKFCLVSAEKALAAGLFGPGNSPISGERTGDQILIARGDAYLWWSPKENPMLGRHGGLSREEMLVPFFAYRV